MNRPTPHPMSKIPARIRALSAVRDPDPVHRVFGSPQGVGGTEGAGSSDTAEEDR